MAIFGQIWHMPPPSPIQRVMGAKSALRPRHDPHCVHPVDRGVELLHLRGLVLPRLADRVLHVRDVVMLEVAEARLVERPEDAREREHVPHTVCLPRRVGVERIATVGPWRCPRVVVPPPVPACALIIWPKVNSYLAK